MMLGTIHRADNRNLPVIGLPGNPLSAIVGLLTLAQPIINSVLGLPQPVLETLTTSHDLYTKSGTRLIAGIAHSGTFSVAEFNGSAMLRGLSHSTGFAVIDSDTSAGSPVRYLPLPHM
jgi:molybdopterin molybdotransferase